MKNTTKTLLALSALAVFSFTSAQAATITYESGTSWDVATWDTGSAPVNGDSVIANASTVLNYDFTVENGQSITTAGNWLALANNGWTNGPGTLTLASGGTINVGRFDARGNGWTVAPTLTIEDGAGLTSTTAAGGGRDFNTVWEAGTSSVTTWNTGTFNLDKHYMTVDLTNYTAGIGSSITLASYTTLNDSTLQGTAFEGVSVFDGSGALTEGVDFTLDYTTGSNITLNVIPEPGNYALIGGLLALGTVMLGRRR